MKKVHEFPKKLAFSSRLQATEEFRTGSLEIEASVLMAGDREVIILHNGERYRLRITAQQKLILTK